MVIGNLHHWPITMPNANPFHCCRVCGFDFGAPPWGENGNHPSYWICPCCSAEAGIGDDTPEQVYHIRIYWLVLKRGEWWDPKEKPDGWSLEEQLKQIPPGFTDEDISKIKRENIKKLVLKGRKAGLSDRQARTRDPKRLP